MKISAFGSARWSALLLLAVTFVAGGVAGMAFERAKPRRDTASLAEGRPFQRRGGMPWFFDSLGITAQQRVSIDSIMRANRPRTESLYATIRPKMDSITDGARRAIDAILTPEQLAKLRAMPRRDFRRGRSDRPPEQAGPRR